MEKPFYINVVISCRQIVLEALQQLVKLTHPELTNGKDEVGCSEEKKEVDSHASSVIEITKKDPQKNGEIEKLKVNGILSSTPEANSPKNSVPTYPEGKNKDSTLIDSDSYMTPNPILETHNYAKIPLMASADPSNTSLSKTASSENR